ncbi:MAG TPA: HAD family hydrolase [Clostridia bacterium]|nr:HAD family hydrolase [Clostridia bacterium]
MFKAILFDLDGTLLPVDTDEFLQEYLKLLSMFTAPYMEPDTFVRHLLEATFCMIGDKDPGKTNEQVFMEKFFALTGLLPEVMKPVFDRFYVTEFCRLREICPANPLVPKIVEAAKRQGKVVIATNPVFPLQAIRERLRWIGIADVAFDLITSYEIMHFCKPHIEYYREIVELIGVDPADCLMVGNDVDEDLIARELGMKSFLVEDYLINRTGRDFITDYRGTLADCLAFLVHLE